MSADLMGSLSAYDENVQKEEKIESSDVAKSLIKKDGSNKKSGRMTNEEILQKLLLYKNDYTLFIEDFGRIRAHGLKKFKLFEYQKELIRNFQNNKFNLILKARQTGISTITAAYLGTYGIFNPHEDILIAAINEEVAKELILKIKTFYENLPSVVRPTITNPRNTESIKLTNGTRFIAMTSTANTGRSFTASFLVLDEAAFVRDVSTLWSGAYPSLSLGGRAIVLSSPDMENSWFHDMCVKAENKENEFKLTKIYWWQRPEYNSEKWKRITIANMCHGDISIFEREYECSFHSSSKTVIPTIKLNELIRKNTTNGVKKINDFVSKSSKQYEDLNIYELPKENAIYLISCDTAEGLGEDRDASAFLIFNITENKIIGEYANKDIKEKNLANLLNDIGITYNNALMVLEMRSTGQLVAQYLIALKYPNMFWSDRRSGLFIDENTPMKIINQYTTKDKNAMPGFYTTSKNKSILVPEMKNIIIDDEIEILTNELLEQLKSYIAVNGKYKAEGKNNDDRVSALFIGLYIKKLYWKLIENNNMLTDEILKFFSREVIRATDDIDMKEVMKFAPVWKTGKYRSLQDPYKHRLLGDLRDFLDAKK
jgi:hypothetical protein